MSASIKLTEFSHGAGCGCKISPAVLEKILSLSGETGEHFHDPFLLVGNSTKDDAAAYDLGNGEVILSTTDFFMPIADDPFDFGRIAAANAISDIYAMGGNPIMAIAILGWPVNKLGPDIAAQVVAGGRSICTQAGIQLAGGHSIDAPEPIFGLAVTGRVNKTRLQKNATASAGCKLFLSKPLGIGILTTAQKQKKLLPQHQHLARDIMCKLNKVGAELAGISQVKAITDVTGFGLCGHLLEMCEASNTRATLDFGAIPILEPVNYYLEQGCIPGGTARNIQSYGDKLGELSERQQLILCDPQTSGGLLIAVEDSGVAEVQALLDSNRCETTCLGELSPYTSGPYINVL